MEAVFSSSSPLSTASTTVQDSQRLTKCLSFERITPNKSGHLLLRTTQRQPTAASSVVSLPKKNKTEKKHSVEMELSPMNGARRRRGRREGGGREGERETYNLQSAQTQSRRLPSDENAQSGGRQAGGREIRARRSGTHHAGGKGGATCYLEVSCKNTASQWIACYFCEFQREFPPNIVHCRRELGHLDDAMVEPDGEEPTLTD